MAMWNQTGATYAPYRNAQRMANKIQPKDQPEEPELVNRQQAAFQQLPTSQRKPLQTAILGNQGEPTTSVNPNVSGNTQGTGSTREASTTGNAAPWDAPNASRYAPRVLNENGQNYLTEHGNRRLLQPNDENGRGELADATAYRDQFWQQNPTGFQAGVGPQQNSDYRAPRASMDMFGNFAGFDAGNYEGEDRDKSAKYTFADAASASGYVPRTKQEAEQWANEFVVPELEARGYKVHWVQGDKMMVSTRENPQGEVIDFIQGADGADPKFAWQQESVGGGSPSMDPLSQAIATPTNPLTGQPEQPTETSAFDELMQDPQWREMLRNLGIQV